MKASAIMTASPCCCSPSDSLADLARGALDGGRVSEHEVAIVVERISEPSRPFLERGLGSATEQRL